MGLCNMWKQEQQNILRNDKFKLNAKSAMQMKVNYTTGHHSIYLALKQTNGPLVIFAEHAIASGMIS